ncbi:hypothetical protein G7070_00835 [Propioniciclava coleopterorum]|uniref:Uncharacterized protein n=2 Tax=Propioniciclava coleopterorum TaxID=2714937 RepID=A0A6G7YAS4_9ACTN|nr:hypothetical protein G7070_00835 [Propioniciclava coleopterorum]
MARVRPDLSRDSLGVGSAFPGIAPNPLLSGEARRRNEELKAGSLAIGTVVDWREVNREQRMVVMLDVTTPDGDQFRGIADEVLTITQIARLAAGQVLAVRYRPAVQDHFVALARDLDEAAVQALAERITGRPRG